MQNGLVAYISPCEVSDYRAELPALYHQAPAFLQTEVACAM
jgi:hypothetical protein